MTIARSQPYRIDLHGVRSPAELLARIPSVAENIDHMFEMLFSDLAGVEGEIPASSSSTASLAADSLSVARSAPTGNYNLSTLGVYDWLAPNGLTNANYRNLGAGALHAKAGGEAMYNNFEWIDGGSSPTIFSQATASATFTTSAADEVANAALSSASGAQGVFTTAGAPYGFRLCVPATAQKRQLVIYAQSFSCNCQLTVELRGQGRIVDTSQLTTRTSGGGGEDLFTITYQAPAGGVLMVEYQLSVAQGVNQGPNVKFVFAYVAPA